MVLGLTLQQFTAARVISMITIFGGFMVGGGLFSDAVLGMNLVLPRPDAPHNVTAFSFPSAPKHVGRISEA
jgi:hypothetical protein